MSSIGHVGQHNCLRSFADARGVIVIALVGLPTVFISDLEAFSECA